MSESSYGSGSPGPATDRHNEPVVDPTQNVLDLVAAEGRRQDDLRAMESKWRDKIDDLGRGHAREMRQSEAARIDAIRAVDVGAVQRAAEVQADQATALAAQVTAAADAFRVSLAAETDPIKKDIADLRRVQYEAQGQKTQVVETQAKGLDSRAVLAAVVAVLALAVLTYGTLRNSTPSTPQVVTVTVPATTTP